MPGLTLGPEELAFFRQQIESLNFGENKVDYGYFAPNASEKSKMDFLNRSIWCIIYANSAPAGFVYNYYLGEAGGRPVVHAGLLKFAVKLGKAAIKLPYFPLGLGNMVNFGPHFTTNIAHLPASAEAFTSFYRNVWPSYETSEKYKEVEVYPEVLELLAKEYVAPILNLNKDSVDTKNFVIHDSLKALAHEFETDWSKVAKSLIPECNAMLEKLLSKTTDANGIVRVNDDLLQVGMVDFHCYSRPNCADFYNQINWQEYTAPVPLRKIA